MNNSPDLIMKKRIIFIFFIISLIIISLAFRLFWIQVIRSGEYRDRAMEQRLRNLAVEPKRGIIFDINEKKLAVSTSAQTVVAVPLEIENPQATARKLTAILDLDYQTIYNRITRQASAVYVKRKIDEEKVEKIRELNLPGILFTEESKRFYPGDNLASHILGFAGIDSQGLDGIELAYDRYLRGEPGRIRIERDAAGRTIPGGIEEFVKPQQGYNLYLTIDEVIQYIAERELENAMNEFDISGGSIIVMDPNDGGILALANRPDYDPNNFADYEQRLWRNRAISDSFEPGSTFKIITTSASLEQGVVDKNDIFFCSGSTKVSGEIINCWRFEGHGRQTFTEVVQNSCNPGFVQVGMRLGADNFYDYINSFNFGQRTNIRLPGEAEGLVYDLRQIGPVEMATMSFGHGITVTPIQLVTAVSTVANDGLMITPRLVNEIRKPDGELVEKIEPVAVRQVISEKTAIKTRELLENVVSSGTGQNAYIEGYRVAGKTGTAKHYGEEVYDSSFVGFFPANNPQFVILVVLYDVTGFPYYGSQTAAPAFRNIAQNIIRYKEITPQLTAEEEKTDIELQIPDVTGLDRGKAEQKLRELGLNVNIYGSGNMVLNQIPLPGAVVKDSSTVLLLTEDEIEDIEIYFIAVPDLTGLSREEAQDLVQQQGLRISFTGYGKVVDQDIEPGIRVPGGTEIKAQLKE